MENSMKQANDNYQSWQDRHDVDKAFEDYLEKEKWPTAEFFTGWDMKDFAVFFAERVKGSNISQE
jgi:hypothetical protein